MSESLNQFMHDWTVLVNRITELENKVAQLSVQPTSQASAPGPYAPPPGASVQAPPGMQAPAPQFPPAPAPAPQAPQAPAMPPQVAPGPQGVPTFEQLLERGMQVSEAKGDQTCIDLIAKYGGKDAQGTIKISLVPQEQYAALFADFGAQLGLH